jgi:pimeloyl-ACP methyl ester carboxylesterase
MTPTLFGNSASPLFGVLHDATGARPRDHGVVLCPPIGQEFVRAHWGLRQLASALSRAGFAVLRFDWYGVGDSSGELRRASIGRWTADAESAAQELRDATGVRRVSLVGLRFGARMALLAAPRIKPASLFLWDPVLDGRTYLAELRALHTTLLVDKNRYWTLRPDRTSREGELVGVDFGRDLVHEIEALPTELPSNFPAVRVGLLETHAIGSGSVDELEAQLRARSAELHRRKASLDAQWTSPEAIENLLLPADAVGRVVEFLTGEERAN